VAVQLVAAGWTDQEIADCLVAWRRRHGENVAKALRPDYVARTISKAKAAPLNHSDDRAHLSLWARPRLGTANISPPLIRPAKEAFHGLVGEVVRAIEPHTEADPVALLLQFLVIFGNIIGRSAHFVADGTTHHLNLFVVLVGTTAKSRKGTSWNNIHRLFVPIDKKWNQECIPSGLSSGEGLIWAVRDPTTKREPVKEDGRHTGTYRDVKTDHGADDKRLMVVESEFVSVLRVLGREGNTLSALIRQAWDKGNLQTLTKNCPAKATGAHISIVGHITREELQRNLGSIHAANGFGNRILWAYVYRSKCLPEGGKIDTVDLDRLTLCLKKAVRFSRQVKEMHRSKKAVALWRVVYPELSAGLPGLLGAMTSRAEAQAMRLACIYALLDSSKVIRAVHLRAALAMWQYCEDSARFVFGASLGDAVAEQVLRALREHPDGMTRTEIRDLFQRHQGGNRIDQALSVLVEQQLARCERRETGGRPGEWWFPVMGATEAPKAT
jgi:hypothetical protein